MFRSLRLALLAEKNDGGRRRRDFAIALARCTRVPRVAVRQRSLILARGLFRPPLHPLGSRALPFENPATLARAGRACRPLAGAGTLDGACCISGEMPAAWRGSGLTWAGQPARILNGAHPKDPAACRPRASLMAPPRVYPGWTPRLGEAHTQARFP